MKNITTIWEFTFFWALRFTFDWFYNGMPRTWMAFIACIIGGFFDVFFIMLVIWLINASVKRIKQKYKYRKPKK